MFLSYKYRLCTPRSHRRALEKAREASWILYNAALEERISAWAHGRQRITYQDQCKSLTAIRRDEDQVWGGYAVNMGRWALSRLDDAFKGFFGRLKRRVGEAGPGFPRFRSQSRWKSFGFAEASGFALAGRRLRLKGIATSIRVNMSRSIPPDAVIKSCVVSEDCGLWYVTFQLELPDAVRIECNSANSMAYDWGIENALTGDNGSVFTTIQPASRLKGAVRRAQRAIARSKRGSRTRRKRIEALGRLKRAERRVRHNALHQLSAAVVAKSPWIGMEALQVKKMTGSARGSTEAPGRNVAAKVSVRRSRRSA
jgi:putative transposase